VTTTLRNAVIAAAPFADRMTVLELADPDKARLMKRIIRKPAAVRRMKLDVAIDVMLAMADTRDGAVIEAARQALEVDKRRKLHEEVAERLREPAMINASSRVVARTEQLLMRDDALDIVRSSPDAIELDPLQLTSWMLQSPAHAFAGAPLKVADHAAIFEAATSGLIDISLLEYLKHVPRQFRNGVVAGLASRYRGPLTSDVLDVVTYEEHQFNGWKGITDVSDEMLAESLCLTSQSRAGLSNTAAFRLVGHGIVDPWRCIALPLNTAQRRALCIAAARIGEWDVVNSVLGQGGIYTSSMAFEGGDISMLLSQAGNERLSNRSRRECMRFCSTNQITTLSDGVLREHLDDIVTMFEGDEGCYAKVQDVFNQTIHKGTGSHTLILKLLRGSHAGKALVSSSESVAAIIVEELISLVGSAPSVWRVIISLSENWVGSLDELAASSKTLAK
jgi:hypothetical protein